MNAASLPDALHTPRDAVEARAIQEAMRGRVRIEDDFGTIRMIAGIDVGYDPARNISRAALVMVPVDTLQAVTTIVEEDETPLWGRARSALHHSHPPPSASWTPLPSRR